MSLIVVSSEKMLALTEQINESRQLFEQAVAERDQLRSDLAAARAEVEQVGKANDQLFAHGEKMFNDLAAARALLAEAREVVASKRQFQAGYPLPKHLQITPERADLARRIDTALAEKDAT